MRVIRILLAVLTVSALVGAPGALGKQYAPPGKAGTSEYAEDIPTAGGNAATPAMGAVNKTSAQINHLGQGRAGVRKLAKLGTTGAAAAQFAQQTAPARVAAQITTPRPSSTSNKPSASGKPSAGTRPRTGIKHPVTAATSTLTASGGSVLSALGHMIGGSNDGGLGVFLPLLLAFGLGWVAAIAFFRTRRRPDAHASEL